MKNPFTQGGITLGAALVALIGTAWCAAELSRLNSRLDVVTASLRAPPAGRTSPAPAGDIESRLKKLEAASPGLGDVMQGIQLHFAKLHFAAEARNWDLAQFERGEVLEGFAAAAALRPEERGVDLAGVMDAFKQTQLAAVKDALDVKDRPLFREAYREAILVCNGCHQTTGRPFIGITVPSQPPVSNQRWEPTASEAP